MNREEKNMVLSILGKFIPSLRRKISSENE
jgi:hypothetical protein